MFSRSSVENGEAARGEIRVISASHLPSFLFTESCWSAEELEEQFN